MGIIVVVMLVFGALRDSGPSTQAERVDAIAQRLACPTCDGESIYVSRAPAAEAIRNEIARQVAAGQSADNEIVAYIEQRFPGSLLLPRAEGVDSLVWILPVVVLVLAFRKWRDEAEAQATEADVALVAESLGTTESSEKNDRDDD
jgi:cytochrome c-type biogenesis protein CcmH